ncbi:MAG: hypothetical protein K2K42_07275, partial [Eubacterium sp.]|nr:hypothetical protein [Eubacterium sp.]
TMEDKVYYFDFGSAGRRKASNVLSMLIFLFISFCFDILLLVGSFWLFERIPNIGIFMPLISYPLFLIALAFKICGIVVQFFPKKIILTEKTIEIKYNNFAYLSHKIFSLSIKYEKLEQCELNTYSKWHFRGKGSTGIPIPLFNWDSLVILQKKFRTFAIPVENAEDFVAEVNKRMEYAKR